MNEKKKECDAKTNSKILTKSYTVCEYTHNQNSDFYVALLLHIFWKGNGVRSCAFNRFMIIVTSA